jgi:hypothetical protein
MLPTDLDSDPDFKKSLSDTLVGQAFYFGLAGVTEQVEITLLVTCADNCRSQVYPLQNYRNKPLI